jgi:type II secretory ATPase GspE/PulE/Tfp pilus assembly ATPase PilB-like protein
MRDGDNLLDDVRSAAARRWMFVPLRRNTDGSVAVAVADPGDSELIDNVSALYHARIVPVPRSAAELTADLRSAFGIGAAAAEELPPFAANGSLEEPPSLSPIARFVDELIRQAWEDGATDVHLEPFENELRARFRIDGILHDVPIPRAFADRAPLVVSRIKVMGGLDVAERRRPQDGRIHFRREVDIRVSTLPTVFGESVDLRLLPTSERAFDLDAIGLPARERNALAGVIGRPHGLVLATGPTGHGKTTTLYACLSRINTAEKKIITVEDPVEIRLRGVNQVEVVPAAGLTFAAGLRSILRQDPDVIMVGEIRDRETAEIAIRASLTGHLVFSTLHTTDASGAVARLVDMGIEPYLVADALAAVVGQRLVRRRCASCQGPSNGGCDACRHTGYRGRTGIFEVLILDENARNAIASRANGQEIRAAARAAGMVPMREDGAAKVAAGLTTADEVRRVAEES